MSNTNFVVWQNTLLLFPRQSKCSTVSNNQRKDEMSKNITILNIPIEKYHSIDRIISVLNELPIEYRIFELDPTISYENLKMLIVKSDLIFVPGDNILKYYGRNVIELIYKYYAIGGSIIYEINPNNSDEQDDLLKLVEMKSTNIRLRTRFGYDIPFAKTDHSFKDRKLFKNIDQVVITQPNHIEYWGNSEPILRSNGNFLSIDGLTDYISSLESKFITPIVLNENNNEGSFISINGYIEIDKLISKEDRLKNKFFLINIFSYFLSKKSRYELITTEMREIEDKLIKIIKRNLNITSNESWLKIIPIQVEQSIKINFNTDTDYQKGLFFIHLKKIIEHNWNSFQNTFDKNNEGKNKSLKWIDHVNKKRKYLTHKAKDPDNDGINFEDINYFKKINNVLQEIITG
jgi:hypothetical protein